MKESTATEPSVGYACAYTPLPLLEAAGFVPHRVLPVGDAPDAAGEVLHENLCPHVKRIVDRILADDLPQLAGFVFVNSCDAMRRLYDAWRRLRPQVPAALIDLPVNADGTGIAYFAAELRRLSDVLGSWSGEPVTRAAVDAALAEYRQLAEQIAKIKSGGVDAALLQFFNDASARSARDNIVAADGLTSSQVADDNSPPLYLFGNVLFTPELLTLVTDCGGRVVDEDLCSGSRPFAALDDSHDASTMTGLAAALLARQPCARTLCEQRPGQLAHRTAQTARAAGARGAILHTVKFCDPYMTRLPGFRQAFSEVQIPLLVLEGDCTTRSIEQQRTRVEAFVEMLAARSTGATR